MTIKYWPILLCVLMILASCGAKKAEPTIINPLYPPCSDAERVELTKKATTEYPFVILKQMSEAENGRYCYSVRKLIDAIDLLPPKVRSEFERARKKHGLRIYIAEDEVSEYKTYTYMPEAMGICSRDLNDAYIVIVSFGTKQALWHEIGHFLDYAIPADRPYVVNDLSDLEDFRNKYANIYDQLFKRGENIYFMKSSVEGFAEAFSFYISNQVENYWIGNKSYERYYPLFQFFDELFNNPEKKINDNNNN